MMIYLTLILALYPYPPDYSDQNIAVDSSTMVLENQTMPVPIHLLSENSLTASFGCNTNIYLDSGTINPGFYQAMNQIIATVTIPTGTVMLRAGNEILLEDGFEVQTGVTLEIEMGECIF